MTELKTRISVFLLCVLTLFSSVFQHSFHSNHSHTHEVHEMKYEEIQILAEISKIEYEEVVLDKRLSPFNIDEKVLLLAIEENERENQEIEKNEEVKILKEESNDLEVKNTRLKKENTAKTDNVENQSVKKAKAVEVAKVQVTQDEPTKPVIKVDNTELPISTTSIGEMNIAPFTLNNEECPHFKLQLSGG